MATARQLEDLETKRRSLDRAALRYAREGRKPATDPRAKFEAAEKALHKAASLETGVVEMARIPRTTCSYCDTPLGETRIPHVFDAVCCSTRCDYALDCLFDGCSLEEVASAWKAGIDSYEALCKWRETPRGVHLRPKTDGEGG